MIEKHLRKSMVFNEKGEKIAEIHNKGIGKKKIIRDYAEKKTMTASIDGREFCSVCDENGKRIAFGEMKNSHLGKIGWCLLINPDVLELKMGEDVCIVRKMEADCFCVQRMGEDHGLFDLAWVRKVSCLRPTVEAKQAMSSTKMVLLYIFAKYLMEAQWMQME